MYTKGIKEHIHIDWPSLVQSLEGNQGDGFIYRGQSNSPNTEWKVISSFNRHYSYSKTLYSFETFIEQQLSDYLFDYYDSYSYEKMKDLADSSLCERLYFLQHYGIPTCLLDFTKDPLTGVYFALSGVALSDTFPLPYSDKDYISVYQLNLNVFPDELNRLNISKL